jgi:lysophospholipase L1-like esterase
MFDKPPAMADRTNVEGGSQSMMGWITATVVGAVLSLALPGPNAVAFDWKRPEFISLAVPTEPPTLSNNCKSRRVAGDQFSRPLRGLRRAIRAGRAPRVLAIGSSSTVGVGASRPANAYVAKLEVGLESVFTGNDFEVVAKGMSGEVAEGQSARMKDTVTEVVPDLVLWQVGTNDAIRHVDIETFKNCLRRSLAWLADHRYDVVLIDPQYGDELTKDAYYERVVAAVAEVAREMRVLLVDRFEAMKELSKARGDSFYLAQDKLHLNDMGHHCMAEQIARAIVAGVLQADAEVTAAAVAPESPLR